jgi:hypothetical protein
MILRKKGKKKTLYVISSDIKKSVKKRKEKEKK